MKKLIRFISNIKNKLRTGQAAIRDVFERRNERMCTVAYDYARGKQSLVYASKALLVRKTPPPQVAGKKATSNKR